MKNGQFIKKLVLIAMLAAIAYIMVFVIRIPVVLFLKYEPKDVIITIGGFIMGPTAAFVISLIVSLIEMVTISETGPIGALMNLLSTCAFACSAAFVYKKKHTIGGAIAGLGVGTVVMVAVMLLWNWLITPFYQGAPREAVEAMLLPIFLPFNLLKAGLNSAFILGLYKPLVTALRKTRLIDGKEKKSTGSKWGVYALAVGLLATCIMLLLVFMGKI
jgi:riboflavin transporter FmnP